MVVLIATIINYVDRVNVCLNIFDITAFVIVWLILSERGSQAGTVLSPSGAR